MIKFLFNILWWALAIFAVGWTLVYNANAENFDTYELAEEFLIENNLSLPIEELTRKDPDTREEIVYYRVELGQGYYTDIITKDLSYRYGEWVENSIGIFFDISFVVLIIQLIRLGIFFILLLQKFAWWINGYDPNREINYVAIVFWW